MRAKFLALASATGLGLLALTGLQSTAQADEGYRHRSSHADYRYRDRGRRDYNRGDRYSDRDRGHRDRYSYNYGYRDHDRR